MSKLSSLAADLFDRFQTIACVEETPEEEVKQIEEKIVKEVKKVEKIADAIYTPTRHSLQDFKNEKFYEFTKEMENLLGEKVYYKNKLKLIDIFTKLFNDITDFTMPL